jgi:indole-3-glycerol phosphate synthase/phosphoribosylanthranilate isomerase
MLDQIIAHKQQVVTSRTSDINAYKNTLNPSKKCMLEALKKHKRAFICEIKLASPSLGLIKKNADISEIARIYEPFADAMSVLAEEKFFLGALANVKKISDEQACPVLCKDIIVSPLQVYEARYYGADAILLMLSVIDDKTYKKCEEVARKLDMDIICETHTAEEISRANNLGARIIGINNRNLANLQIDLETTMRLRPLVHKQALVVAESGFVNHQQILRYAGVVDGFLVGTSLMRAPRIDLALRELVFGRVKICGLTNAHDARLAYDYGAYYGGLNFSNLSKRRISKEEAKVIIKSAPLSYGGVFVNQPIDEVLDRAQELKLDFVQLHGEEAQDYIRELRRLLPPDCEIWKAFRVKNQIPVLENNNADLILFDTFSAETYGGTGEVFNWELCKAYNGQKFGLAGGLNPSNIHAASLHNAFMLDIASGAEESDCRRKSPQKLAQIFAALRGE